MHDATLHTTLIETTDAAMSRGLVGSPTFLLDGRDPFAYTGDLPGLACRVYATTEGLQGLPEAGDMRRALKEAAGSPQSR
jgi:hypothetical protein